jgi:DNA primase
MVSPNDEPANPDKPSIRQREKLLGKEDLRALLASPAEVAAALGLCTRRTGNGNVLVLCPWHAERNPSCSLFVGAQQDLRVHCYACGAGGDVFALIAQVNGLDIRKDFVGVLHEARALVGAHVGLAAGQAEPSLSVARRKAPRPEPGLSAALYHAVAWAWLSLCAEHQELCLERQERSRGRDYLAERGLLLQADAAGIVSLPDTIHDARVVVGQLRFGGSERRAFSSDQLDAAGIVKLGEHGGYAFRWPEHLVLIPWVDRRGAITAVQQRYVGTDEPLNKYVWPPGRAAHQPFGVEVLRNKRNVDIVIVEGALDVLARRELANMHGEDIDVIGIASAGSPLAGLPIDLLRGKRVRVAVDRDAAGERAASALRKALDPIARKVVRSVPTIDGAKDWNQQLTGELALRGK